MRHEEVNQELRSVVFDYFYWFSRFEFALKENGYLKKGPRSIAQADWVKFIDLHRNDYYPGNQAKELLEDPPKTQTVNGRGVEWHDLVFDEGQSELSKVVLIIKTIRNNLFHGGKHGVDDWDNPDRVRFLLSRGIVVLNEFSILSRLEADYLRYY